MLKLAEENSYRFVTFVRDLSLSAEVQLLNTNAKTNLCIFYLNLFKVYTILDCKLFLINKKYITFSTLEDWKK